MFGKTTLDIFEEEAAIIDKDILGVDGEALDAELESALENLPVVDYQEKVERINLTKTCDGNYLVKYSDVHEYAVDNDIDDITTALSNIATANNIEESSIVVMIDSKESILEACKKEGCGGKKCASEELKQLTQKNVKIACKKGKCGTKEGCCKKEGCAKEGCKK